jgi:PhnB protein
MAVLNPYLNFPGNTEEAFNFYKSVFGGEFPMLMRFKDTPEKDRVPAHEQEKIMHIALPVGTSILMATDALESMGHTLQTGNNQSISYSADSEEEGRKIFEGLSQNGKVTVPYSKQSWGDMFGMITDQFEIQWMVAYSDQYKP